MKAGQVDRRIQRTRQLLQDALLELILEKGYAAITVQDILDRANLGRSTFYVHYRDKDDLLVSEFEHFKSMFEDFDTHIPGDKQKQTTRASSPSLAFFRHAGDQHRLYKAMVGKQGGEVVQKYLYQYVSDLMKDHLNRQIAQTKQLTVPREILIHYMVSSFLALLTWWLDHDMPYSAERMEEIFTTLTVSGFRNALGQ
jgi:AcrR family transcriptional regulator